MSKEHICTKEAEIAQIKQLAETNNCMKEAELAEIKQLIRSYSSNEERTYQNWHDLRILEEKQDMYDKQHEETLELIREISKCQTKLISEIIELNTTFKTIKYIIGVLIGVLGLIVSIIW